jgi:hypothetical protein
MQDSTNCAGYLRDAESSKERNLYHVQDHPEGNRRDKLAGNNREGYTTVFRFRTGLLFIATVMTASRK